MAKKQEYMKASSYEGRKGEIKKVVLLYSGGLDTSVMIKWIMEEYKAEVIALTIDIGQQTDDLAAIKKKALKLGAVKAVVIDAKEEFANEYIAKGIKANGSYQGRYFLSTPLGRPLLAKLAVKVAVEEGADCIAHGCTGKGNDQVRIEGTVLALNPDMKIIAPVREWAMGRDEELKYAKKHGIEVRQTKDKPYSYDDNMWGVTAEGGEIENPALVPPLEKILLISTPPDKAPDKEEVLKIEFVKGIPVALNDKQLKLVNLILELNKIGAKHGIGVAHHLEDRVVGLKVRGIYEAPAAEAIITAHKTLEKYVSTRLENEFKETVDTKWAYLCYGGLWYEPLMNDLNAYIDRVNEKVTGIVTLKLFKGRVEAVAVETPNTIFEEKLATFMASDSFNQNASPGFIELYTLQMRLAQRSEKTAFLSLGKRKNKVELLPYVKTLHKDGVKLYATYKTNKFLKSNGVPSILVNKISDASPTFDLLNLMDAKRFDFIVNIPTKIDESKKEKADWQIIQEKAISTNVRLITSPFVAKSFIEKLHSEKV